MARADTYSRVVAWVRIILPLAALGLLSTLFLLSRSVDPGKPVPIGQLDLEQRAQDLGAVNPRFAGVTDKGEEITFAARIARPDRNDATRLIAEQVTAQLRLSGGTVIDITSTEAEMNETDRTVRLTGLVRLDTSTGYVVQTAQLDTSLDEIRASTPGAVRATGPLGTLNAGRMVLHNNSESDAPELLFTKGVKLVYRPGQTGDAPK